MCSWWHGSGRYSDFLIFTGGHKGSDFSTSRSDENIRNNFTCPNEPLTFPWRGISAVVRVFSRADNTRTPPYLEYFARLLGAPGSPTYRAYGQLSFLKNWKLVIRRFVAMRRMTRLQCFPRLSWEMWQKIRHIYKSDGRISNISDLEFFSCFSLGVIQGPTYRPYGFRRKFSNLEKFFIIHTLGSDLSTLRIREEAW